MDNLEKEIIGLNFTPNEKRLLSYIDKLEERIIKLEKLTYCITIENEDSPITTKRYTNGGNIDQG